MYLKHFGLQEEPFGVNPDPRFLHLAEAHREALASLYYGIESGRGFLSLIAEPGMGKTTLLFFLLEKFSRTAKTAFVFQTLCNPREFMRLLLAELGHESDTDDFVKLHEEFNRRLLAEARLGKRFIVVVDEAQNLDASVLESVRLLSNFETPRAKLLTIILAGQPELAVKLASPGLAQLRQRISVVNKLNPFPEEEVRNYIAHRLSVAGFKGVFPFTPEALREVTKFSGGIPRNINNFCFNALSLACAMRKDVVDLAIAREVVADLDITKFLPVAPESKAEVATESKVVSTPPVPVEVETKAPAEKAAPNPEVAIEIAAQTVPEPAAQPTPEPQVESLPPLPPSDGTAVMPVKNALRITEVPTAEVAELPKPAATSHRETAILERRSDHALTPDWAMAYMRELVFRLRNWQQSLDRNGRSHSMRTRGTRPN